MRFIRVASKGVYADEGPINHVARGGKRCGGRLDQAARRPDWSDVSVKRSI